MAESAGEKKRLSLSRNKGKTEVAKRFAEVPTEDLVTSKRKPQSKNTDRSQQWALNVFRSWNSSLDESKSCQETILWEGDPRKLCDMLSQFILEARQHSGDPYSPKTLLQILSNLQSFAFNNNPYAPHFMNHKDPIFKELHNVLNNESKRLLKDGVGAVKKQARVVTIEEEEKLWSSNVMGTNSPISLQNAIFYYCGLYLCLRGGIEHRELTLSQFTVEEVDDVSSGEKVKCLKYVEHGSKNRQGLVHEVHLDNKVVSHYANHSLGERCFVSLFELYVSKLPEEAKVKGTFYCKPKIKFSRDDTIWYFKTPVGHNILSSKLKNMFEMAQLNIKDIHNHSLKTTSISRMYEKGVDEKVIMERSGHFSLGGVRSYERVSEKTKMEVSHLLSSNEVASKKKSPLTPVNVEQEDVCRADDRKIKEKSGKTEKENDKVFNMHGCTVNITFNK